MKHESFKCPKCKKPTLVLDGTESSHCGSCGFEEHVADLDKDIERRADKFVKELEKFAEYCKHAVLHCRYCGKKLKEVKPYLWQCVNKKCKDRYKISLSVG